MNHDITACGGKWIDISTFSEPRRKMCSKCRVVERIVVHDLEEPEVEDGLSPEELQRFLRETEAQDRSITRERFVLRILTLCALVTAILALGTALLR